MKEEFSSRRLTMFVGELQWTSSTNYFRSTREKNQMENVTVPGSAHGAALQLFMNRSEEEQIL